MRESPTTDPQHERFDLFDDSGRPLGRSKPRGEVHRDGDWHRSLHLWVWGVEDGEPFIIFQRRSMTKDTWPGALDVAVGGHFRSGETLAATLREAEEEIGLSVTVDDVIQVGRRFHAWRDETFHDREINEIYAVRSDRSLPDYRQHPEEIDALVRIDIEVALKLFRGETSVVDALSSARSDRSPRLISLQLKDFADVSDGYAIRMLASLQQLAAGAQPAPFIIRAGG